MANKIIHKHSSVVTDEKPKLPSSSQLEYGELAVNYADGYETISLKNTNDNIVEFKSTKYVTDIIEKNEKIISITLGELNKRIDSIEASNETFVTNDVFESELGEVTENLSATQAFIAEKDMVTTRALVDLDKRINELEDFKPDGFVTKEELENEKVEHETNINNIHTTIKDNELVTATALTDLSERIDALEGLTNNNTSMVLCTYSELRSLIDNKELVAGNTYRIIDFVTTTTQDETISLNRKFDILVTALSDDTLSEDAKVCQNEDDTYFSHNDLSSWVVKYCFDNDTSRFSWADTVNGKGVIYYMKDEYNNEAWYDFKNILFLRTDDFFNTYSFLPHLEGGNYYFTFSNIVNNEIIDGTIYDENITVSIQNKIDKINGTKYSLNNTIFINDSSGYTRYNAIGVGNNNNTFGSKCQANTILQHCYKNVVGTMFRNNVINQYFCNNIVSGQFEYNTLGIQCYNNNFSGHIWFTTFGSQFNYCSFNIPEGSTLEYCDFGSGIGFLNGIPAIRKVTFENNVAWYNSTTYVSDLQTVDGRTLADAITIEHDEQLYVSKVGDKYSVVKYSDINNLNDDVESLKESVSNLQETQNNAEFYNNVYVGSTISLLSNFSNPDFDTESTSNNIITHGYVGTLKNLNVEGDYVIIKSIGAYYREGDTSQVTSDLVYCRLLKFDTVSNEWILVSQSNESKSITSVAPEGLFTFDMVHRVDNMFINTDDKIAVVYVTDPNSAANNFTTAKLGFKSINKPGSLNSATLSSTPSVHNGYAPALTFGYVNPLKDSSEVYIGSFSNVNNAYKRASESDICANQNITKITFKISNTERENSNGYIEQFISGGPYTINNVAYYYVTQIVNWNGETKHRQIVYTKDANNNIIPISGNWVKFIDHDDNGAPILLSKGSETVNLSSEQTINGVKTFSNNIKINNKSVISTAIDSGELKVLHNNSTKGFILRTKNTDDNVLPLELLSTNGTDYYQYNFPANNGTVALMEEVLDIIQDNEYTIALASTALDTRIKVLEKKTPGAYAMVYHDTSESVATITPNTFHMWDEMPSLTIIFDGETPGITNEYIFQFKSGETPTSLTLPSGLLWANDELPIIESNCTYQISILNELATIMKFSTTSVYPTNLG